MSDKIPDLRGVDLSAFKARGKVADYSKFNALMDKYQGTNKAYPLKPILDYLGISLYTLRNWCKKHDISLSQRTDSEGNKFVAFT